MQQTDVVALLIADLHLSHKPPISRIDNWYESMVKGMGQLRALWDIHRKVPIICAGDIFDKWNPNPELINLAIRYLPNMYAVPGQHDLAWHNYSDIKKTGYWTLVESGVITNLEPDNPVEIGTIRLWGFPWGFDLQPPKNPHDLITEIAVVHKYLWMKGTGHHNASDKAKVQNIRINGFDLVVSGDNHISFYSRFLGEDKGRPDFYNCGSFFRRKQDEKDHKPSIGMLKKNGTVERHFLDTSEDKFSDNGGERISNSDVSGFLWELKELGDVAINFSDAVKRILDNGVSEEVRKIVLEAME